MKQFSRPLKFFLQTWRFSCDGKAAATSRLEKLKQVVAYLEVHEEELVQKLIRDNFTPWQTAHQEVKVSLVFLRDFIEKQLRRTMESQPLGTFFVIPAFDFPPVLFALQFFALYALGNRIIIRPSRQIRQTSLFYQKLVRDLELEGASIVTDLSGKDFLLSAHLASLRAKFPFPGRRPGYGLIFSGTRSVWEQVLPYTRFFHVAAFNGPGNSLAYLHASATNLPEIARLLAYAAFANGGQYCFSIKTLLLDEAVYSQFLPILREEITQLKMGNPCEEDTVIGPIRNEFVQRLWFRLVRRHRNQILAGGDFQRRAFRELGETTLIQPTLITAREIPTTEVFGPLLFLVKVRDFHQAMAQIRNNPFGLYATFFGEFDPEQRRQIQNLEGTHYGAIDLNRWVDNGSYLQGKWDGSNIVQLKKGWGGMKQSGLIIDRRCSPPKRLQGRYRPEELAFRHPLSGEEKRYFRWVEEDEEKSV